MKTAAARTIEPMHDRILVKRVEISELTPSGLILIPEAAQAIPKYAKVVAVGPGRWIDGYFYKTAVKPGDLVLVPGAGNDYPDWEQSDTILIQEGDIGAILG